MKCLECIFADVFVLACVRTSRRTGPWSNENINRRNEKLRDQKCDCHKNCQSGLILAFLISWYKTYPDPTTKNRKNFNLLMFRNTAGSTEYKTFSNELKTAL